MSMEAAIKTTDLPEKPLVNHGCSQSSSRTDSRPVFVPKQSSRPRQRGALPREPFELAPFPQHAFTSTQFFPRPVPHGPTPSPSQQAASLNALIPPLHEQTGQFSEQHGVLPRLEGSSKKRQNAAPAQKGDFPSARKFSRSWHRVSPQQPSDQRGVLPTPQEQTYKPHQRGAIGPPFQEQAFQAPFVHSSSSPQHVPMDPRNFPPFLDMKSPFSEMWLQLEGAIQSRERMLMAMKAEMEKSLSQVKVLKVGALKEREEVEARKAGATENMEVISKQAGKIKSAREGLEQISTDLSVQVAELNCLRQQVQKQQSVLNLLESLKDHHDTLNDENTFMTKNLQDSEVKLATMERELAGSKQTSELLGKAALKWIGDLEDAETGCELPIYFATNASSNPSVVPSMLQISKDTTEVFCKSTTASSLNGEHETLGHTAALKQPKVEAVS